jgi:hypothetical protein
VHPDVPFASIFWALLDKVSTKGEFELAIFRHFDGDNVGDTWMLLFSCLTEDTEGECSTHSALNALLSYSTLYQLVLGFPISAVKACAVLCGAAN